jgi:hypothetical protein
MQLQRDHQECERRLGSARMNSVLFGVGGLGLGLLVGTMMARRQR